MYCNIGRKRFLATSAEAIKQQQFNVFDRGVKLIQRSRTPLLDPELSRKKEYLRDEVALRTIERLAFITRDFTKVLDLGCHLGNLLRSLCTETEVPKNGDYAATEITKQLNNDKKIIRDKIKQLVMFDSSKEAIFRDENEPYVKNFPGEVIRQVGDEEAFNHECLQESDQYDAVISNLSLHWINDLPKTLSNINRVLKPDGLFMGTLFGGDTLYELRTSLQLAELERKGGMSPRVSPLVHLNDIGSLLTRAGFNLLTIDQEEIIIGGYPDIVSLCEDLQAMGEQNAVLSRATYLPRDVLLAANEIYKSLHGETDDKGNVTLPATTNVIFMIGWKKSENQPKPLARGSGQVNLKDVLSN
jgi:NADH dehydrogenase [ubiquinone] 1 alpha subcomplex assembly factor 5